jgi:hypothetical protein
MGEKWRPNDAWDMYPGFFYMSQICDMGPIILLRFRRKACWGFLSPFKNPTASAGFEPANLGTSAPPKPRTNNSYLCTFSYLVPFETAAARYTSYSQWPGHHHHLQCCSNTLGSALGLRRITDMSLLSSLTNFLVVKCVLPWAVTQNFADSSGDALLMVVGLK